MAIDNSTIVRAVSSLEIVGNEDGLIPAFGLYLTRHYADYYNRISFAFLHAMERRGPEQAARARADLIETGHVCGFNTMGGIMLSDEWEAVVEPMIETRQDWICGIVGVINALGWGEWRIDHLHDHELKVSCANSYESDGYLRDYPERSAGGVCFLATGVVSSLMNLIFHGDITTRPARTEDYYKQLFHEGDDRFVAVETTCRAHGAPRCEWAARRAGSR